MNFIRLCTLLYAGLIRLYPPGFRNEFGSEMQAVFVEALSARTKTPVVHPSAIMLRELRDFPVNLLGAHLSDWKANKAASRSSPEKTASLAQCGVFGFGASFAFISLLQVIARLQMDGSQPSGSLVITALWLLAYPLAGALGGAGFGLVVGARGKIALFALGGALAFYLGSRVASYAAVRVLSPSMPFSAILWSMIELAIIGSFAGLLVGVIQRDRLGMLHFAFASVVGSTVGCAVGFLIAEVFWGIAQVIASYQGPLAYSWVMSTAPFVLVKLTSVVGGIVGSAVLGWAVRRAMPNGFSQSPS